MKKRILILHTGGTFGMVPQEPLPTLAPSQVQENITTYVPELEQIAEIDFRMIFNLDSANIRPTHWQQMAREIYARLDDYDGFVIIHGTDSMAYSATALSYMLRNLNKPVILTGSQRPLAEIRSDARMNLINAVELATRQIPEVCVFFQTQLLRGNRTIKISSGDYGAFSSPNFPPLAEVGLDLEISDDHLIPQGKPALQDKICPDVLALEFFPGLRSNYWRSLTTTNLRAIVIEGLGLGNVSIQEESLVPLVQEWCDSGKIVTVTSTCRHGRVDLSRYQNGQELAAAGAVGAGDMTTEAAIVKLMHLLAYHPDDPEAIKRALTLPIAGEVTPA